MFSYLIFGQQKSKVETSSILERKSAVVDLLEKVQNSGKSLSGAQLNEYDIFTQCDTFDRIYNLAEDYPAILGLDLLYLIEHKYAADALLDHAIEHKNRGGLLTLTWHIRNPLHHCARGEFFTCTKTTMSDEEFEKIVTKGTPEFGLWEKDVDAVVPLLKKLEEEGIIVLFRPYHEMHGHWFWWGQKTRMPDLWKNLHERLTEYHDLKNLLWVWNSNEIYAKKRFYAPDLDEKVTYFPGNYFVDYISSDHYPKVRADQDLLRTAKTLTADFPTKPYALAEIGRLPDYQTRKDIRPAWILLWGDNYLDRSWVDGELQHRAQGAQNIDFSKNSIEETISFFLAEDVLMMRDINSLRQNSIVYSIPKERNKCGTGRKS